MITDAITEPTERPAIIRLENVSLEYDTPAGTLHALTEVSLDVYEGESLGIVGESGCGKSSLAMTVLQLPPPTKGSVRYRGTELSALSPRALRQIRPELQIVFQDPVSSLNPRRRVRDIVAELLTVRGVGTRKDRAQKADDMLHRVGLDPKHFAQRRPRELSGGQCQRVAIARALISGADVLICDEATASLDVSLRAQILNLLEDLREEMGFTLLFISHDLGAVKNISDRIAVMYLGRIVEIAKADSIYSSPAHPYTAGLLAAVPRIDAVGRAAGKATVPGEPPSPVNPPSGCRFRTRCPRAQDVCAIENPPLVELAEGHVAACHFPLMAAGQGSR